MIPSSGDFPRAASGTPIAMRSASSPEQSAPSTALAVAQTCAAVMRLLEALVLSLQSESSSGSQQGLESSIETIRDEFHRAQNLAACSSPPGSILSSKSSSKCSFKASSHLDRSTLQTSARSLPSSLRHLATTSRLPLSQPSARIHAFASPTCVPLYVPFVAESSRMPSMALEWPALAPTPHSAQSDRGLRRAGRARSFRACFAWASLVNMSLSRDTSRLVVFQSVALLNRLAAFRRTPSHLLLRSARAVKCLQAAARRTIFARAAAKLHIQRLAKAPKPMRNWFVGLDPAGRLLYQSALGGVPQLAHPSGVPSSAMLSAAGELLPPRWPSSTSGWFMAPELLGGFCFHRPSDDVISWHPPADNLAAPPSPLPRLPFRQPPQHAGASVAAPPEPWVVRYRGEHICYLNQRTGALRRGPWVCLHEPVTGRIYAFDPKSGESSWVIPYGWMERWIHR